MKTASAPISRALVQVWEAKKAIYEETKDLSPEEVAAYFKKRSEEFAEGLGKHWVKNPDGTLSLG